MYSYTIPNTYDEEFEKYAEEYEKALAEIIRNFDDDSEDNKSLSDIAYSIANVGRGTAERTESINYLNEEIYTN